MSLSGATVAVTGATGFLGRYIVRELLSRGARVIGVVRDPGRVPSLVAKGVEMRRADLGDRDALTRAFEGASALVSNAALFSIGQRSWQAHQRTNLDGTENVLRAALAARVERVVHVSSTAVYDPPFRSPVTEEHRTRMRERPRGGEAYALSKALSERLAWRIAGDTGLLLTCVRPCAIYGAFDPNFTRYFKRLLAWPVLPLPAFFRLPLVYAGDVAIGIVRSLEREHAVGKAYNLTGVDETAFDLARAWGEVTGKRPLLLPVPLPVRVVFDHALATRELDFSNRSLRAGLAETFEIEAAEGA